MDVINLALRILSVTFRHIKHIYSILHYVKVKCIYYVLTCAIRIWYVVHDEKLMQLGVTALIVYIFWGGGKDLE